LIRFFSLWSDFDLQGEADKLTQKIAAVLFSFFFFSFLKVLALKLVVLMLLLH